MTRKSLISFRFKFLTLMIVAAMFIGGCGAGQKDPITVPVATDAIDDNDLTIVTTFYPMYLFTSNITKDIPNVKVINMTESTTGCLHDYSLTTKDLKTLENAQVLVTHGAGAESFLEKVIERRPDLQIVTASTGIEFIEEEYSHDHDHEAASAEEHGHEHAINPHVWVSPSNAIVEVQNISHVLAQLDPAHATNYQENAKEAIAKLEELKSKMHESLDGLTNRNIVVFHDSFPYFAKEFDLNIVTTMEGEEGSEPSAKELSETIEEVQENQVKALFVEPQYASKTANVISAETGAKVYTVDPVVSGPMDDLDAYIKAMKANLMTLEEALK